MIQVTHTLIAAQSGGGSSGGYIFNFQKGIINPVISSSIGTLSNQSDSATKLASIIAILIRISFIGASVFCLFYLVWGAFDWIVSQGEKASLEAARNKMIHAVIGLTVIAIILLLFTFIGTVLQIDLLNMVIPTASDIK